MPQFRRSTFWRGVTAFCLAALSVVGQPAGESTAWAESPTAVARRVDQAISKQLPPNPGVSAAPVNDADFLRRVTLDLAGRIPSPEETRSYLADKSADKQTRKVEELLSSRDFSRNWAAYWRDVIFSRATDARAVNFQFVFENWMTTQLEQGRPWNEITRELLTATGDVRENGATALMFAHEGNPEELAGEVSRIFLGIQIQCANCHNHPSDAWTREQFHELAAFFPRVRVRPLLNQTPRTFEVVSLDVARRDPREIFENPEQLMLFLDRNRDGKINKQEAARLPRFSTFFERVIEIGDKNGDGALSVAELKNLPEPPMQARNTIEHFMSDLEDPSAQGTPMQPIFFLTDQKSKSGLTDVARRDQLASYVTAPSNEWYAKSFVNRLWTELVGAGFYEPVDDIGPLRIARHEAVLTQLADGFIASGYDYRWLYRVITQTDVYQRPLRSHSGTANEAVEFACATPTRLRSDQIHESLMRISGRPAEPYRLGPFGQAMANNAGMNMAAETGMAPGQLQRYAEKRRFAEVFGFDPSTPQDDLQDTIPQALFMMNSRTIEGLISARGNTPLARLLRMHNDDETVLRELYLLTLTREPTEREIAICQEHYLEVRDRTEVLEDIFWSLLNSSEFLTKR